MQMIHLEEAIKIAINHLGEDYFSGLNIEYKENKELKVIRHNNNVVIEYDELSSLFYGLTQIKLHKDETDYSLSFEKNFAHSGVMHDCSRNGVLNIETAKKFILLSALFGMNTFMLYTEDVYEIEGEPYFGYLRGRYSKSELKEIVEYGDSFGVEVIPCIQTLSHLNQALRWDAFADVRESGMTLLVGADKTYALIEKMIKSCREVFTSKRIHIGMDEAFDLGAYRFVFTGEVIDKTKEFLSHLNRVEAICKKYDFHPMMWEDMFFKLNENSRDWLAPNNKINEEVKNLIPDVDLVYWDYYHNDVKHYDNKFKLSLDTGKKIIFAGGAISWIGFAPNITNSLENSTAGLKSAIKNGVNEVFVTSWGDNGNECSVFASIPSLVLYSNFNYLGHSSNAELSKLLECVTGDDFEAWKHLELPNRLRKELLWHENPSKPLLYQDPLNGFYDNKVKDEYSKTYKKYALKLKKIAKNSEQFSYIFHTLADLCSLLEYKSVIGLRLRKAYQENNIEGLKKLTKELKIIIKRLGQFKASLLNQWMIENKIQGFDVIDGRLGYLKNRLETTLKFVDDYLNNRIKDIPELKENIIANGNDDAPLSDNSWAMIASVNGI